MYFLSRLYISYEFVSSFWLLRDTCGWCTHLQARVGGHMHVYADSQKNSFVLRLVRIMLSNQYFPHWHRGILFIYCSFSSPLLLLRTWFSFLSFSCRACGSLSSLGFCIYFVPHAYRSTACLSSRQVFRLLVNEINDLWERDFDENYRKL